MDHDGVVGLGEEVEEEGCNVMLLNRLLLMSIEVKAIDPSSRRPDFIFPMILFSSLSFVERTMFLEFLISVAR